MEGKERGREERQGEIRLNRKPVPRIATQAYIKIELHHKFNETVLDR